MPFHDIFVVLAVLQAVFLKDAAVSDNAVCLDGSPGAYYILAGNQSTKWYLHHQGGGELCHCSLQRGATVALDGTHTQLKFATEWSFAAVLNCK